MQATLEIYRCLNFDGRIFTRIQTNEVVSTINYTLYRNDTPVAQLKSGDSNSAVCFDEQHAGSFRVVAELRMPDGKIERVSSKTISVNAPQRLRAGKFIKARKTNLKSNHHSYEHISRYFLEIKFTPGGREKLEQESSAKIQNFLAFCNHKYKVNSGKEKNILTSVYSTRITDQLKYSTLADLYKVAAYGSYQQLQAIADELEALSYVAYCSVTPDTSNMEPQQLAPTEGRTIEEPAVQENITPDFSQKQTYLDAGTGMNIRAVWDKGEDGAFATVRHLDFGVYRNHEDLAGNITVVNSRSETNDCNHGTASAGCIAAVKNGSGVTGIAHGCRFYFYDTGDLDLIIRDAQPGDIVSLDIQFKVNGEYIPVTGSKSWWDKINVLVKNDVVVILAAGNGGLDLSMSTQVFTDYGDNGSMLVGACYHHTGGRVYFSNYNHSTSLINSWGDWSVTTTGYSSLQKLPGNERTYTKDFAGTSSATPLCSGALALIQSYAKRHYGVFLNAFEMRELIINSGYSEGKEGGIGYRPDVLAATQYLDDMMANKNPPLAVAPADFSVIGTIDSSRAYELDGSASQNVASCNWSIVSGKGDFWLQEKQGGPWVSNVNTLKTRALIPANKSGEVTYRLTVIDQYNNISTDDVTVTVLAAVPDNAPLMTKIHVQFS